MVWPGFTSFSVLVFFPSIDHLFFFVHCFWCYCIWHRWGSFSQPVYYVFFFGDFSVRHKDWLTCSDGIYRPSELCYNFSILNDLTQMVDFFFSWIPGHGCTTVLLFWIYLLLQMLVLIQQCFSVHWELLIVFCLRINWLSFKLKRECPFSSHSLWPFSCWLGWSSWSLERCSIEGYF